MSISSWILANPSLGLLGGVCIIGVSIAGLATLRSTADNYTNHLFRSIPDENNYGRSWAEVMDGKDFHDSPLVRHSYEKLINGDTNYNNGNYLIYYGSEACSHCAHFLFNDHTLARGTLSIDKDKMSNGAYMKAFDFTKTDPELSKIGIKFLWYEDIPDKRMSGEDSEYWTLPWDSWQYTDTKKGRVAGTFKRNDRSSVDFRKIIDAAQRKFKDKVPGTPTVIVYKQGKPLVFNQDTIPGLEHKKQGEDISNENVLIRFIKYYFTKVK